jgi:hypothetical protein
LEVSLDELREFLCNQAAEISRLLHGDVEIARQTLAKHIEQLILTPTEAPDGPLLEVSGNVELFNVLGDSEEVCSSNGGQRRLWSVLHTPFRVPTTGIVLNPRLDITSCKYRMIESPTD